MAWESSEWVARTAAGMSDTDVLERRMDWARRLYAHVAERVGTDVDVAELEAQFDFMWSPVPVDEVRSSDPYSSRVLEDGVKGSFAGLLAELDRVCATLPGLNPGELGVDHEVTQARNGMWHRVARAMCDPRCTQEDLERVTHEVYVEVVTAAHARAMHRLHSQVEGVRALQRLCAAVGEGRDISESLECDMEHLCTVLTAPPPSLAHELTRMGVPLVALRDLLFPSQVAVPMSGAERYANVVWWSQAYLEPVDAATIVALSDLHLLLAQPPAWRGWDGIGVWRVDSEAVRVATETGGLRAVVACPEAVHTHALRPYAVVATATTTSVALRVPRFARVVLELVLAGLLRPRRVRAECLLSLVQRFEVATSFEHDRVVTGLLEGAPHSAAALHSTASASASASAALVALAPPRAPLAPEGAVQLVPALLDAHRVPKSLLRDYVVVVIIRDRLSACPPNVAIAYISVAAGVVQLTNLPDVGDASSMIRDHSSGSLRQAVSHVIKKVAVKLQGRGTSADDVRYDKTPSWMPGCTGLVVSLEGRRALAAYLDELVTAMQPPEGPAFAKEWHCSRSAMSHARRKRVLHVSGSG